ncbi:unnamed protein product [Dibothriocephalus latus]|uniref:Uncharacterized protein n=1 Tax=Dibothriocephalus latus TaxID=60516 RepID=A0A3P7NAV8_DIBLA|nr:unnamed protein product [Dibothriocephalus latus]
MESLSYGSNAKMSEVAGEGLITMEELGGSIKSNLDRVDNHIPPTYHDIQENTKPLEKLDQDSISPMHRNLMQNCVSKLKEQ